jgi:hypothetical protein
MIGKKAAGSLSLKEQIERVQAEAEAFIDAKAEELNKTTPGVPLGVLRMMITNKAPGCACRAALAEMESE